MIFDRCIEFDIRYSLRGWEVVVGWWGGRAGGRFPGGGVGTYSLGPFIPGRVVWVVGPFPRSIPRSVP